MLIEFPYRKEPSINDGHIFRPVAKVLLKGMDNRQIIDYFYIDSGADYTLIPYKLGKFLGLKAEKSKLQEIQGISGVVGVIFSKIGMRIGNHDFEARIGWAQIEHIPLLLGRIDIFDRFKITFLQSEKKVFFGFQG